MKNQLIISGVFILLLSCGGNPEESGTAVTEEDPTFCECTELFFDEPYNRFYLEDRQKPFSGECQDLHPNGEKKLVKHFKNGKVHGKMITYYDNGQVEDEREFEDNFQVGERIQYNRKGEVTYHALYERGKVTEILVVRPDLKESEDY